MSFPDPLTQEYVKKVFSILSQDNEHAEFLDYIEENVDWTVFGTFPLAGRYHSRKAFVVSPRSP
jgi:hypothetical protein